jgi:hypothetical protein
MTGRSFAPKGRRLRQAHKRCLFQLDADAKTVGVTIISRSRDVGLTIAVADACIRGPHFEGRRRAARMDHGNAITELPFRSEQRRAGKLALMEIPSE